MRQTDLGLCSDNQADPEGLHNAGGRSRPAWPAGSTVSATFSPCGAYRTELSEIWNASLPPAMFLMMNPSVAGIRHADPTLIRTGRFARGWGYGGQMIGNIHAYRATNSQLLASVADPVGPGNDEAILGMARRAGLVVLAYGLPPQKLRPRAKTLVEILAEAGIAMHYLRLSKDGTPAHPLYLPGNLKPIPLGIAESPRKTPTR